MVNIEISDDGIAKIAREYKVNELYLFGSVLRDDFHSGSDIDVLVSFQVNAHLSYFDLLSFKEELEALFHSKVDIVEKEGLINPYRRKEILSTARRIYAA